MCHEKKYINSSYSHSQVSNLLNQTNYHNSLILITYLIDNDGGELQSW